MVYTNSRTNSSRKGRANYSREFKQRLVKAANQAYRSQNSHRSTGSMPTSCSNGDVMPKSKQLRYIPSNCCCPLHPRSSACLRTSSLKSSRKRQPLNRHHYSELVNLISATKWVHTLNLETCSHFPWCHSGSEHLALLYK